jgi:2-iminobutanoate/2-iminopropanoate deaminase
LTIRSIRTEGAPKAVGPYSQGVAAGTYVFTSGQLPMTPAGEMIHGDVEKAARQALDNVRAVLAAAGAGPGDVVKVTVYLTDMDDARSCVAVARLPLDAPLEIEAVAVVS